MNAVGLERFGNPEVLHRMEVADPVPSENEVVVRVPSTSVNMLDVLVRKGYTSLGITMPHVIGTDVSGKIELVGKNVKGFAAGDAVISNSLFGCGTCNACTSKNESVCQKWKVVGRDIWGSYGELVKLPSSLLIASPKGFNQEELGCMPLSLGTSWRLLHTLADAHEGDTVVIRGASGNVGIFSTMIAKAMGLNVIALTRNEGKAAKLKQLKADSVINVSDPGNDAQKQVMDLTYGNGADFVLESQGSSLEQSLEMLKNNGKVLLFGTIAGSQAALDVKKVYLKSRCIMGSIASSKQELREALNFIASNNIKPIIAKSLPMESAPEAHEMLERSEHFGKIVLRHNW